MSRHARKRRLKRQKKAKPIWGPSPFRFIGRVMNQPVFMFASPFSGLLLAEMYPPYPVRHD